MKKVYFLLMLLCTTITYSQTFTTNTSPVGMEHNMLFNAHTRYQVTQTGSAKVSEAAMFDGRFGPSYTSVAPTISDPTVILIENLPGYHTQTGAWVGWSTRYWQAKRFKIEGYDTYNGNIWKTLADYSNIDYTGGTKFITKINTSGVYKKLRFTFYTAYGTDGKLGLSELFYLHPEGMQPYEGLLDNSWLKSGSNISYSNGNVGIGTATPSFPLEVNGYVKFDRKDHDYTSIQIGHDSNTRIFSDNSDSEYYGGGMFFRVHDEAATHKYRDAMMLAKNGNVGIGTTTMGAHKLAVEGSIGAREIKVETTAWPDYVFEKEYSLPTLSEVENHIKEKGHLPNIPSAKEVAKEGGIELGRMNKKLLEKIEELTLYTIQQEKQLKKQSKEIEELKKMVKKLIEKKK